MVFNTRMVLPMSRILAVVIGAMFFPSIACAASTGGAEKLVELGQTTTPLVAPTCPAGPLKNCVIILTHTTALQTTSDGVRNPTKVKQPGWIVAFSVGLSNLVSDPTQEHNLLHSLNAQLGGPPQLALAVLRPGPKHTYRVVAQSDSLHVTPFLGQVLGEPLSPPNTFSTFMALPVKAGDVIGLTSATWAPVLALDLTNSKFEYRQSRTKSCTHAPASQTALTSVGQSAAFLCAYTGTRVEYSATEVVNVPYPKTYVH
jgi:hypothetical protein